MHNYTTPNWAEERAVKAQGKVHAVDLIEPRQSALVVIDMQNHYVAPGFPSEAAAARDIVSNINRMAEAMRASGALVIWIKTTAKGALEHWGNHHKHKLTPANAERRLKSLSESSEGYKLFKGLAAAPEDLTVTKIKYSAMIPGSSELHQVLTANGIDTILIAGTKTNVCCESTGRDASMLGFRVVLLADATATSTDDEHAASLNNFLIYFGDVMTTDEAISRIVK